MRYSIAEIEHYTGIKAHTIRTWEQRYDVLTPHRTQTNIRYYDDSHLRKLLNIASLIRCGHKISQLSKLTDPELYELMEKHLSTEDHSSPYSHQVDAMILASLTYDEVTFHRVFADCMIRFGMEATYVHVLQPVLQRTGLMWSKKELSLFQEHFVSNLIRQKLFTAIDSLSKPKPDAKSWVLFLSEDEEHDIGLLFANFLIRQYGGKVYYLGQRVPFEVAEENMSRLSPDYMLTFIQCSSKVERAKRFTNDISKAFPNCHSLIAGQSQLFETLTQPDNVSFLTSPEQLLGYLVETNGSSSSRVVQ